MQGYKMGAILCGAIILQSTILPHLKVKEAGLDLILIVVVYNGLYLNIQQAPLYGFLGGLAEDIFSGFLLGSNALSKTIIGFLIVAIERKIYKDNIITPGLLIFLVTLLEGVIFTFIFFILRVQFSPVKHWQTVVVPGAFYNSLAGTLMFFIFKKIEKRRRFSR